MISGFVVPPGSVTNLAANMRNTLGALIESPVFEDGIGTVYFEAINSLSTKPTQITVEITTNMIDAASGNPVHFLANSETGELLYEWKPLDELTLAATEINQFTRYRRTLDYRGRIKLRLRRSGTVYSDSMLDASFTVIDNIRVSSPPADVCFSFPESPFAPGYPAATSPLTVRCIVGNADTSTPTTARTVKVCTRWRYLDQIIDNWKTNTMSHIEGTGDGLGNGEVYQATLPPPVEVGDLEYFFICEFGADHYSSPDYTQTGLNGYPYPPEGSTSRLFRDNPTEMSIRLRPYASTYGAVTIETDQLESGITMTLIGDSLWQGLVPTSPHTLTNLSWRFKATGQYQADTGTYSTGTTYWASHESREPRFIPHSGTCEKTGPEERLGLRIESGGYVSLTLNDQTLSYRACRAEYQNFNTWPTEAEIFSESTSRQFPQKDVNTFNRWPTNTDQTASEFFASAASSTNLFFASPFLTPNQWVAGGAAYESERREADALNKPADTTGFCNLALRLKGGEKALDLGYIRNHTSSQVDGLKQVSFNCRLAQSSSYRDVAYNRNELSKSNYLIRATAKMHAPMSPGQPSVSLIGYYQSPGTFYEYRVTQFPDTRNAASGYDACTGHQLFKWVDGRPTHIGTPITYMQGTQSISNSVTLEMRLFTVNNDSTVIRCLFNSYTRIFATDGASPLSAGSYGILSAEGRASFTDMSLQPTTANADATGAAVLVLDSSSYANFSTQIENWYLPAGRYEAQNIFTPYGIYAIKPMQKIGIFLQQTSEDFSGEPSGQWTLAHETTVPEFDYTRIILPVQHWQPHFVKIQVTEGIADVVVDEVSLTSWRGQPSGAPAEDEWLATEAWVVSNNTERAHVVQMDSSRAKPSATQQIRSPLSTRGHSGISFDYRVLQPPTCLAVQTADAATPEIWSDIALLTLTNESSWASVFVTTGTPSNNYLRVSNKPIGGQASLVELDDVTVWSYQPSTAADWRAYNAKVTDYDEARVALDMSKACFLNHSPTQEAAPPQYREDPYLQSPVLTTGLGTLSFLARAYETNQTASLAVYATTNGADAPFGQWFEIHRFENIGRPLYERLSFTADEGNNYHAIRLVNKLSEGAPRVCLEEVVIEEPPHPDADIVSITTALPGKTYRSSGTNIEFTIRLAGRFGLRQADPDVSAGTYPAIGVTVNGEIGWAELRGLTAEETENGWRTDAVFHYAVKPGDMAEPLTLSALKGSQRKGDAYAWDSHGWDVFNDETLANAVWRFNRPQMAASDRYDADLSLANVVVKTLMIAPDTPSELWATDSASLRIQTDRPVENANVILTVWSSDPNVLRVGVPLGQESVSVSIAPGCSEATVPIHGVSPGIASLHVQRTGDGQNHSGGNPTNDVRKVVSVLQPLQQWSELGKVLTEGGLYHMGHCAPNADGFSLVCDGGGVGTTFRFTSVPGLVFTNLSLAVSNGATVVIENLAIDNSNNTNKLSAILAADGHPENKLMLAGRNSVSGGLCAAGLGVGEGRTLTVTSTAKEKGSLMACGGLLAAGIGGGLYNACGLISIGGHAVVSARGGDYCIGIGSGFGTEGGDLRVNEQAVVLATGGRFFSLDAGPNNHGSPPASLHFSGGLILTGHGTSGISGFVTDLHSSTTVEGTTPDTWYMLSRDGIDLGLLYAATTEIGVHSISNVTQGGTYSLLPEDGIPPIAFELTRRDPVLPQGIRGDTTLYLPWLQKFGLAEADLSVIESKHFDTAWLLDRDPSTFESAEFSIADIRVEGPVIRGSLRLEASSSDNGKQKIERINGKIVTYGADSLAEEFKVLTECAISASEGVFNFEIPCPGNTRFIRAAIIFDE